MFIAILGLVLFALLVSNIQVIHDVHFIRFEIASSSTETFIMLCSRHVCLVNNDGL